MGITHAKVSVKVDAADSTKVRPSDWNTDHVVSDIQTTSGDLSWNESLKRLVLGFGGVFTSAFASRLEIKDTPPNWGALTNIYNSLRVAIGGFIRQRQHGSDGVAITEAIVGCNEIPSTAANASYGSGLSGYAKTSHVSVPSVGVYAQGTCETDSSGSYGVNAVATNAPKQDCNAGEGNLTDYLFGVEANLNNMPETTDIYGSAVTNASNTTPIVITTAIPHGRVTGQSVTLYAVYGNTAANGTFNCTVLTPTTLSLDGSVGNGAYTPGTGLMFSTRAGAGQVAFFHAIGSCASKGRAYFYAFYANDPSAFFHSVKYDAAFKARDGVTDIALDCGTQHTGNGSNSQQVYFHGKNAGGTNVGGAIFLDADGNLQLQVPSAFLYSFATGRAILAATGAVDAPSICLNGSLTTGFYAPAAGEMSLVVNSQSRFKVDNTAGVVIDGVGRIRSGTGDPNGAVVGSPGDLYLRTNGGAGTSFYVKESGVATNAGWVGK